MNDAWAMEEGFWLGDIDRNRSLLSRDCVMAFPAPVGIMTGEAIARSLEGAPRWSAISMIERVLTRPDADTLVLGYRAEGRRDGAEPYRAYCTSTYRRDGAGWTIVQHQQTPIA